MKMVVPVLSRKEAIMRSKSSEEVDGDDEAISMGVMIRWMSTGCWLWFGGGSSGTECALKSDHCCQEITSTVDT